MRPNLAILFAFAPIAMCSLTGAAAAPSSDETAIKELEDHFAQAFNAKDLDGIMKTYAPEVFVFDVVPPRQYVGIAAYRKDWQNLLAGYKGLLTFTISDLAVSTDGTIGYSHSIQRVVGTDQKGAASDMTVRVTDVYRKVKGNWYVVQEHVSVPVDLNGM